MSRELKTVSQFSSQGAWTEPQIRWWIFQSASNGMDRHKVVYRIGRRVYLDAQAFDRWIDAQNPQAVAQ